MARKTAGVTQGDLGDALGVSFQRVQKYELGRNRLSGARLFDAARLCGVTPNFFFEGMDQEMVEARDARLNRRSWPLADLTLGNIMGDPGTAELVAQLRSLPPRHRLAIERMIAELAAAPDDDANQEGR
jgi:transcriptional regulator with XRE-family HTH domain